MKSIFKRKTRVFFYEKKQIIKKKVSLKSYSFWFELLNINLTLI